MSLQGAPSQGVRPTAAREGDDVSRLRMSRDAALQAAREAMRDATRLTRLLTVLNEVGSLSHLLDRTLATLTELFAAEIVVLLDPAGIGHYGALASIGLPEEIAHEPFSGHEDGHVRTAMREGAPILVTHAGRDEITDHQLRDLGADAVVYVPIIASHSPRGVLILGRCRDLPFSYSEVGLLTAMAHRIGLAIEQAQRRQQLEQIVSMERKIGPDVEEAQVARNAICMLPTLVGADGATFLVIGEDDKVRAQFSHGHVPQPDVELDRLVDTLLNTTCLRTFAPFSAQTVKASVREGEVAATAADGAMIALPIGRERVEGLMCAFRRSSTAFDPDALPIAMLYAGQTSAALENARLYRALQNELTDRIHAEEAAKRSEQRLGALIRSVHDLIVVVGDDDRVRYVNPAAGRVWGEPSERSGDLFDPVQPEDRDALQRLLARLRHETSQTLAGAIHLRTGMGDWREYDIILSTQKDDDAVGGIVITCHDVTERRTYERNLETLAFRDPLTGLANRAYFLDRLEDALARGAIEGASVAVIFFDLDDFKVINDSLGHAAGDHVLRVVAERMREGLRRGDLGARLGGDEFTVLLERPGDVAMVGAIAERLMDCVRTPISLGDRDVVVGGSFGIAIGEAGRDNAADLLRKADVAMYDAKSKGKNVCSVFHEELDDTAMQRLELEVELRRALAGNELRVYFQPIVSLEDRRIRGVEALVRWQHPRRGLLLPDEFIPLAERTGLIIELGQRVLEESFRCMREWEAANVGRMTLGINYSPRQLQHAAVVETFFQTARAYGIDPSWVIIEVTENSLIKDLDEIGAELQRLRQQGVRIAIDDFVTGYSSIKYLKRLPVDIVKIDRAFVSDITRDARDCAIAQAVVALARAFDLGIVAEGVETEDQATALQALGRMDAQGYLFAPPLPADECMALVRGLGQPLGRVGRICEATG